jgi:hypothetical protein
MINKKLLIAVVLVGLCVSPVMAALNDDNPHMALYGDYYLGPDGNGAADAVFYGEDIDFDGYTAARPGETFVIHMFSNRMDGWPQPNSYRTAFWYNSGTTTRGIERTDWSDTAGTFSNGPYVTNYTGYTMIDRYHGTGSQASIYEGLCIVSWEFTVLETAVVGSTMEIGLQFYTWGIGGGRQYEFDADYGAMTLEILPPETGRLGDFTDNFGGLPDDIIDAYDVDALSDAILNGGDVPTFDLVIDGVLDSLDMDMLIEMLVDTTIVDAGEEFGFVTGTFYGDFNLDGTVNLLDLNKLTTNYNGFGGWTLGDANGDGSISLLDLNKLTANYNSTVVVPEPATMTLLALGAVALIRRKS